MSRSEPVKIHVSPWTTLLLAVFIWAASPELLAALLLAALLHELGHYAMLKHQGAQVEAIRISPFGAQMRLRPYPQLSYGQEMLAVLAGPGVNLILAFVLAAAGKLWPLGYLFSGAQLVLGLFNLLPILPLDGGAFLWLLVAWCTEPFTADRLVGAISRCMTVFLLLVGAAVIYLEQGSPFLLLGALGPVWSGMSEKKLVKPRISR